MGKYGSSHLYWNDPNYPEWGNSDHFNFLSTILTNTFFSTSFSEIFSQFDRTRFDLHVLQKLLLFNERRLRKNKNNIVFVNFEGEGVGGSSFRFISFSTVLPFDICIVLVFDTWIFDIFIFGIFTFDISWANLFQNFQKEVSRNFDSQTTFALLIEIYPPCAFHKFSLSHPLETRERGSP